MVKEESSLQVCFVDFRFLAIPFLLELRALMDWIWTDSTLAIGSWLQMEDIYANVFVLKCWREIEKVCDKQIFRLQQL